MAIQKSKTYITVIILMNLVYLSFIGIKLENKYCSGNAAVVKTITRPVEDKHKPSALNNTGLTNGSSSNDKLWVFTDNDIEKMYLYDKLINKEHHFNKINLKIFREKLFATAGEDLNQYLVVHQGNTAVASQLNYNGNKRLHFNITEKFHRLLPQNFTLQEHGRCSVVGNSGAILQSKCGEDIDKSEFVYRCNAAPIKPFVRDAGNKTNLTSFNPSIFGNRYDSFGRNDSLSSFLRDMKQYHGIVWASCFSYKVYTDQCIQALFNYTNNENQFVLGHPDHFQRVVNFWRTKGFKKRLSSGFYFASTALSHCKEVHLYGFWPFTHKPGTTFMKVPYHYYDKMKYTLESKNGPHGMTTEFAILLQLHLRGTLKLHAGEC